MGDAVGSDVFDAVFSVYVIVGFGSDGVDVMSFRFRLFGITSAIDVPKID